MQRRETGERVANQRAIKNLWLVYLRDGPELEG